MDARLGLDADCRCRRADPSSTRRPATDNKRLVRHVFRDGSVPAARTTHEKKVRPEHFRLDAVRRRVTHLVGRPGRTRRRTSPPISSAQVRTELLATSTVVLLFTSCVHRAPGGLPSPAEPDASVSESLVRFTFPLEKSKEFTWNVATPTAYDGQPEYFWAVEWAVPEGRQGKDPNGLDVGIRWRPTGAKSGSLADLIHEGEVTVHTECMTCGIPAYIPHTDPSARAEVVDDRVTITVRGRDAVARLFPTRPDSVFLSRFRRGDSREVGWTVPIRMPDTLH